MSRQRNSYRGGSQSRSFNRKPRRSFGGRRSGGYRARRVARSFDPTYLIKSSKNAPTKKLEVIRIDHEFNDFNLEPTIKRNIQTKGYSTPTPIQDQTIPLTLKGKDVVGVANTGTGKTAAFLIPLINKALLNKDEHVLIITPTRELAVQIEEEFYALAKNLRIHSALCIGGVGMGGQVNKLRKNPQFVIGTPGRLKDLENRGILRLGGFSSIVLDEVDRMLDMGFINDVQDLISRLPEQRQSLFFSATLEGKVREVMARFLKNPIIISVKTQAVTDHVEQKIVRIAGRNKVDLLHDLLIQDGFDKVLIFGRTKWGMEKMTDVLRDRGFKATAIHGNKTQNQRQRALNKFKRGEVNILLATDVAQRGLDIDDVTHVINYDLPETKEDYIHRIGRTGRANKKGVAITIMP